MTLASQAGPRRPEPLRPVVVTPAEGGPPRPLARLGTAACATAGILLIALSFRWAASIGAAPGVQFVFWIGVLGGLLPASVTVVRRRTVRTDRLWALLSLAAVTGAPRLLRAATPLFPDEFGWWRASLDVVHAAGGGALVPGTDLLPGLPVAVGAVSSVTGLSVWTAAMLLLFAAHVLGLVAVYRLTETLLRNSAYAGMAALVWAFNPLSLYGGVRFTSVALSVPIALFILALVARAATDQRRGRRVGATVLLTVLLALSDLMVALLLVVLLTAVAVVSLVRNRQRSVQLTVVDGEVRSEWVGEDERPGLWALLGTVGAAAVGLVALLVHVTGGAFVPSAWYGPRNLLGSPSRATAIEAVLAVLAAVVLLALCVDRAWALWNNPRRYSGRVLVLSLAGMVSFLGLPAGLLLPASAPLRGAWLLTYVGVALLAAPPLVRGIELGRQLAQSAVQEAAVAPVAALALAIVLLGCTATGEGVGYRYPGPVEFGRDGRADLAEIASIARAFSAEHGRVGILTDRYTGPAFAGWSGSRMPRGAALLPGNELLQGVDPTPAQLSGLVQRGYGYLVVDLRMAGVDPADGHNFGPDDPGEGRMSRETALLRLDRVPWVSRVAASPHYRVYRFDLNGAGLPLVDQADNWGTDYRPRGVAPTPDLPASSAYPAPALTPADNAAVTPALPPASDTLPATSAAAAAGPGARAAAPGGSGPQGAAGNASSAPGSPQRSSAAKAGRSGSPGKSSAGKPTTASHQPGKSSPTKPRTTGARPTKGSTGSKPSRPAGPPKSSGSSRSPRPSQPSAPRAGEPQPKPQNGHGGNGPSGDHGNGNGKGRASAPGQLKKQEARPAAERRDATFGSAPPGKLPPGKAAGPSRSAVPPGHSQQDQQAPAADRARRGEQ